MSYKPINIVNPLLLEKNYLKKKKKKKLEKFSKDGQHVQGTERIKHSGLELSILGTGLEA